MRLYYRMMRPHDFAWFIEHGGGSRVLMMPGLYVPSRRRGLRPWPGRKHVRTAGPPTGVTRTRRQRVISFVLQYDSAGVHA